MAEELTVSEGNKEEKYATLLPQLKAIIDNESDIIAIMANVSAAIKETFDFLWVGFYRVCGSQLIPLFKGRWPARELHTAKGCAALHRQKNARLSCLT